MKDATRRSFLKTSLGGGAGLWLAQHLGAGTSFAADDESPPVRAKSCIVLWMQGGASHIDTFDPKSGAVGGPFKTINTAVAGAQFCEHLPQLAARANKLAVLRSMTSKEGNHERARFLGHTGYAPNPTVAYPSLGAWASHGEDGTSALPSFMSVGGPSAGGGFLGPAHGPLVIKRAGEPPANLAYGDGVDDARFDRRLDALRAMNDRFTASDNASKARNAVIERSVRMMRAQEISAFNLDSESAATRSAYGDTNFGRGCLLARRLVEQGVRVVEVTLPGWDTHQNNFERTEKLMGELDPAMAALIDDLDQRGLLDSTLVVWMGDFGRTPRINANEGRDHHPRAWSTVLAGGGIRPGIVHGSTDAEGDKVVDQPVTIPNFFATITHQMGIAPDKTVLSPGGRPVSITERGTVIRELLT